MAPTLANKTIELTLTVVSSAGEELAFEFFAVPKPAEQSIGEILIDWGDSHIEKADCLITDGEISEMVNNAALVAMRRAAHRYATDGKRTIRVKAPMGWLPLKRLPDQTISIDSPLPTLTIGETDDKCRLLASDTLPRLVMPAAGAETSLLAGICPELLKSNPQLEFFDEAFMATGLKAIPAGLFTPCTAIASLTRTFARTSITALEPMALAAADEATVCEETFADCGELVRVANPFSEGVLPVCAEGFLLGSPCSFFDWCAPERREEMGWQRPAAQPTDPAFEFEWAAHDTDAHPVVIFYPIDLELKGDLWVQWGDGASERVDWNKTQILEHAFAALGTYRVRLHYTAREPVRPFRLGSGVKAIHTALPLMHPRSAEARGDLCGWAADLRELESIAEPLFVNNPTVVNLEQAFAGCLRLREVPDDVLKGLKAVKVDGMFAFCKSLSRLPADYLAADRDLRLDCFAPTVRPQPAALPYIDSTVAAP